VHEFDPATGVAHVIGHLPGAIGHASVLNLNGTILVAEEETTMARSRGAAVRTGVLRPELPGAG